MLSPGVVNSLTVSLIISNPPSLISTTWSTSTSDGFEEDAALAAGSEAIISIGKMQKDIRMIADHAFFKSNTHVSLLDFHVYFGVSNTHYPYLLSL